jgi:hypothetical protein
LGRDKLKMISRQAGTGAMRSRRCLGRAQRIRNNLE